MTATNSKMVVAAGPSDFEPRRMPLPGLKLPASGEIHTWHLDLGLLGRSLQIALDGHDDGAEQITLTAGQLRFARNFYLRLLLGAYLGLPGKSVRINRSDRGKPVLDATVHSQDLHFSMAKSEDRLLIGFSFGKHLGVDLELAGRRAKNARALARRYFSEAEAESLMKLAPDDLDMAFLRTWACKEAVVKASGEGIANQLCRFTVETDPAGPAKILEFEDEDAAHWSLALLRPETRFIGAVAIRDEGAKISAFRLLPAEK
jgi:4'-phosphopantetheinyl transferase